MDAREYVKIVKENCFTGRKCNECPFNDWERGVCSCSGDYTGIKDPVAIAEQIKAERDKPQLPEKTLILYDSTCADEVEIHFEHLNDSINAIIDYLKARETEQK